MWTQARRLWGQDGTNGKDGVSPTVTIGNNGNWFIDGVDTGKKAVGQDGVNGKDGVSPTVTIGDKSAHVGVTVRMVKT